MRQKRQPVTCKGPEAQQNWVLWAVHDIGVWSGPWEAEVKRTREGDKAEAETVARSLLKSIYLLFLSALSHVLLGKRKQYFLQACG